MKCYYLIPAKTIVFSDVKLSGFLSCTASWKKKANYCYKDFAALLHKLEKLVQRTEIYFS